MQNTVEDFWRMIWEQQSKVVLMITHLYESGVVSRLTNILSTIEDEMVVFGNARFKTKILNV